MTTVHRSAQHAVVESVASGLAANADADADQLADLMAAQLEGRRASDKP